MAGVTTLVLLLGVLPASAGVLNTYSDRSTFEAIGGTRTDIDFESFGLTPGQYVSYSTAAGITAGGVNFVGHEGAGYVLWLSNPGDATENFQSGTRLRGPDQFANSYLLATMPADVTAFGIDLASGMPAAASFRIELDGIDVGVIIETQEQPVRTFFGVRTDTPFTQVKLYTVNGTFNTHGLFDNVSYIVGGGQTGGGTGDPPAPEAETPELATFLSIGTGLLVLGLRRGRRMLNAI